MKQSSIKTKRLELRPLNIKDHDVWFQAYACSPKKKSKYDRDPYPARTCTKIAYKKILKKYKKMAADDKTYIWGVFDRKSKALIGLLDISIINRRPLQLANLGYRVFNPYWKMGYAKEFVHAGITLGFKNLKINRMEAVIDSDNKASVRLVKSLGLMSEGVRRKYYYQDNEWADQVVFTAQREIWGLSKLVLKD